MEFRARILEIQFGNKQDQKEIWCRNNNRLLEILENAVDEASEDAKPKIQESLDRIKKIIGNDNR